MKNITNKLSLALIIGIALNLSVYSQTNEITYQGNLDSSGSPANDLFDFKFRLFNSLTGGTQLGNEVSVDDVTVSDGVFNVKLDFGYDFSLANVFMEISVKSSRVPGAFTTLTPRQKLSSSPTAVRSINSADSERLGGFSANSFVRTNTNNFIRNSLTEQPLSSFRISGNGIANRFIANTSLTVGTNVITNPFVATGIGTDTGGVDGFGEVVGRFHFNSTNRHTAVSIDSTSNRDAVLYFSAGGQAKWGIRNDESTNEFQVRYHTGGANNSLLRLDKRNLEEGFDFFVEADAMYTKDLYLTDPRLVSSAPGSSRVLCVETFGDTPKRIGFCSAAPILGFADSNSEQQKKLIEKLQTEIDSLKKVQKELLKLKDLVCLDKPDAEICKVQF